MIVLGDSLGSLITAAFLCKNGHRVLIVEDRSEEYVTSEFFDEDATAFVSGCSPKKLLYNLFRELSIPIHHQKKFHVNDLAYQLALPECRVDVGSTWNLFYQEIKREFYDDIRQIGNLYKEVFKCDKLISEVLYNHLLLPQKLSSKLKTNLIMHVESIFNINEDNRGIPELSTNELRNSSFKKTLDLQINMLKGLSRESSSMTSLFLLGAFQRGIVPEPNKLSLLKQIIKEQVVKTHGEFLSITKIESIKASKRNPLKDKKGVVIKLEGQKRAIEGKVMVYGMPLYTLPRVLKDTSLSGRLNRMAKRFAPTTARLTFTFNIDRWGIPVGMRGRVLFIPENGKSTPVNRVIKKRKDLLVSISPDEREGAGANSCLLKGSIKEPFKGGVIRKERVKQLYDEMVSYLKELIPFFDDFVKPVPTITFNDIRLDKLKGGDFIYDSSFLKSLSLGEVESCEVIKNIFFAGKEFLPELGFEGEVISGWRTANVIISKFKGQKAY
jgi:hypothetical protein